MKNRERRLENSPRWQSAGGTREVGEKGGSGRVVLFSRRTAPDTGAAGGGGGGVAATAAAAGTKQLELPVC